VLLEGLLGAGTGEVWVPTSYGIGAGSGTSGTERQ